MSRPRTPDQRSRYAKLNGRLNKYSLLVQQIYDTLNLEAATIATGTGHAAGQFRFSDYPQTTDAVNRLQNRFVREMRGLIYSGTSAEWAQSNLVQDLLASSVLKSYGAQIHGVRTKVYYQTNSDALKAFQERTDRGMNLSTKLWNQSENYKQELEYAISSAIEKGTSAVALSKRLSKYLQDFPSLKKDYKEMYGQAVDCHDCEYRSIRLARSEINMAYRTAEQTRWKQMDFVVGYEIKLSHSHPETDVCDSLAGKYPKTFVWTGWHPNDMCYVIPILKSEDEFWSDNQETPSVNEVTDVPIGFKQWLRDNQERIAMAESRGTLPYWLSMNSSLVSEVQAQAYAEDDAMYRAMAGDREVIREQRKKLRELRTSGEYTDIDFNPIHGGLKATHIHHNLDKRGGPYELNVQEAGFRAGHAVILESEYGTTIGMRYTEGTWDGQPFEVAGRETGTVNNVLKGLKHCASKKRTKIAVLDFPNGNYDENILSQAIRRYRGLEKLQDGQFLKFDRIICVQNRRIVYDEIF